ncbi:MAG: hypothetical protein OIF32_11255 [Campylobacterales bacterium]|nr:hypothetical protein [Campylobacterales bacterium]
MNIDLNCENLLNLMELQKTNKNIAQVDKVINNTKDFEKIAKHVVSLNDYLHHHHGFVSLSSSHNYLKIKCDNDKQDETISKEFHEKVRAWGEKYKVELERVDGKEVYYILGSL